MIAISPDYYDFPETLRNPYLRIPAAIEIPGEPWDSSSASSGSYRLITVRPTETGGLSAWLEHIICAKKEDTCAITTSEVSTALAEVRDSFSVTTVQLAQMLGVSRQAIYDWSEGNPVKAENRKRIAAIREAARQWRDTYPKSMGCIVAEEIEGTSLLTLLCADKLDFPRIQLALKRIAQRLIEAEGNRPASARELAGRFEMKSVSEDDHQRNLFNASLRFGRKG